MKGAPCVPHARQDVVEMTIHKQVSEDGTGYLYYSRLDILEIAHQ